jgi:predicted metal-dependent hydrolase
MPSALAEIIHVEGCPPVKIERRTGQRNLRIRVKPDMVFVSGPRHSSKTELVAFLNERLDWIRKTSQRLQQSRSSLDKLMQDKQGNLYLRGEWIPIVNRHTRPGSEDWLLVDRQIRIDVYPPEAISNDSTNPRGNQDTNPADTKIPPEILRQFQKDLAKQQLTAEFEAISAALPFRWNRLFIRSQKTKWGTCSSKGNISLNWRLIKCPEHIRRYIMIHELCHTVHLNHSKGFWWLVMQYYPAFKEAHKWLKEHGELVFA